MPTPALATGVCPTERARVNVASVKVARPQPRSGERQRGDAHRDQVDHALMTLEHATHEERGLGARHGAEPLPGTGGADDVEQAGLVLEVQEHGSLRGARLLTVGDDA